jgi:hypothetical protein
VGASLPRIAARLVSPDACAADGDCASGPPSCLVGVCINGTCGQQIASGFCFAGGSCRAPGELDPTNTCQACAPSLAQDRFSPLLDGTACDDSNACTSGDHCQSGSCIPTATVTCFAIDSCHVVGVCAQSTGVCSNPAKPDGFSCNDNNACTSGESCQSGVCGAPTSTVSCSPLDQCHDVGVCSPLTGGCSTPNKADGTACNDGNACTIGETCQSGICGTPTSIVTCRALDQCHDVGACDRATGACSNPSKPDGTTCDDGNACTTGETCQGGTCSGGTAVTCTALDQCHDVGTCDPAARGCSNPNKADGTACNDDNSCTMGESCQNGVCGSPTSTIACTAADECHRVGTCDTVTGACSNPPQPDGTLCGGGTCMSGACVAMVDASMPDATTRDAGAIDAARGDASGSDARIQDGSGSPTIANSAGGCGCHVAGREAAGGDGDTLGSWTVVLMSVFWCHRRKPVPRQNCFRQG